MEGELACWEEESAKDAPKVATHYTVFLGNFFNNLVSFIERCNLFRVAIIRGSTVYTMQPTLVLNEGILQPVSVCVREGETHTHHVTAAEWQKGQLLLP